MGKVLKHLKPYIVPIILALALVLLQAFMDLKLPNIMSDIVNNGVMKQDLGEVWHYGQIMIGVTAVALVASICSTLISALVSAGYGKKLRKAVYKQVEKFSLNEFSKINTSSLITRTTNDITQVQNVVLMALRMIAMAPMMCIGGIIMALSQDKGMSFIFVVVIPILVLVIILLARKIVPLFTVQQKRIDKINQVVREKLTGVRVIRAFGTEEYERERYSKANKDIYDVALKAIYMMSMLMPLIMFIINISSVGIIWVGSHRVGDGSIQIGDMMAFMQYAMQVLFSLLMVTMIFVMIPRAIVSMKRIKEVLELEPSVSDDKTENVEIPTPGTIEFSDVEFKYTDDSEPVLENMTFSINKGETVAIIGGTGSGKSTILNMMLRFYDSTKGTIKIGGVDIKEMSQNQLREMIGFVPQKVNLFTGTIAENIRYGKENATDEEIEEAAKIAQAYDFISELDEKFDSSVSQGGTNYSGGQKQRISIARAIVKKPEIYLFDDSFSALDYATDAKLRKSLKENAEGATMVIVAQRVSTILDADKIILIDDGQIVAMGTHHELMETSEEYKEIVMSQITREEAERSGK